MYGMVRMLSRLQREFESIFDKNSAILDVPLETFDESDVGPLMPGSVKTEIPVFMLDVSACPGGVVPLHIFEMRYRQVRGCLWKTIVCDCTQGCDLFRRRVLVQLVSGCQAGEEGVFVVVMLKCLSPRGSHRLSFCYIIVQMFNDIGTKDNRFGMLVTDPTTKRPCKYGAVMEVCVYGRVTVLRCYGARLPETMSFIAKCNECSLTGLCSNALCPYMVPYGGGCHTQC